MQQTNTTTLKKNKFIYYIHAGFWIYLTLQITHLALSMGNYDIYKWLPFEMPAYAMNFYLIYLLIFPLYFRVRPVYKPILITILYLFAIAGFYVIYYYIIERFIITVPQENLDKIFSASNYASLLRLSVVSGLYSVFVHFLVDWVKGQRDKNELIHRNQESEIALLKSQINPHFLFNTLNNIYSLVYRKSDDAPPAVMKLSEIMRYMLYDASAELVPLETEIRYLKSYIELEKLRISNKNAVEFVIEGNTEGKKIAPMLMIPFVENAFKHGNTYSGNPCIFVKLIADDSRIIFRTENCTESDINSQKEKSFGIGLSNVKRRLELIYKDSYSLEILSEDNKYIVNLKIEV